MLVFLWEFWFEVFCEFPTVCLLDEFKVACFIWETSWIELFLGKFLFGFDIWVLFCNLYLSVGLEESLLLLSLSFRSNIDLRPFCISCLFWSIIKPSILVLSYLSSSLIYLIISSLDDWFWSLSSLRTAYDCVVLWTSLSPYHELLSFKFDNLWRCFIDLTY